MRRFAVRPVRQKRRRECRGEMAVALEKERAKALAKIQSALKVFEEAARSKLAEKIKKELLWGLDDEDIKELNSKLSTDSLLFEITEKILGQG